ncbi:hypothetical protein BHM03_00059936 [Ensete ventricosum]|nr:hypothetical protein BHM03_00059936 [Ensete ventricosum]
MCPRAGRSRSCPQAPPLWAVAPASSAGLPCRLLPLRAALASLAGWPWPQPGRGWPTYMGAGRPSSLLPWLRKYNKNAKNDSTRFNLITRSLKPIFRTKTLALIPLLGNLNGCITCAVKIKTKTDFPCRSNRRAKDWGLEKNAKIDKTALYDRLILPREIVYPCIPDPDGEDEGGQASFSLVISTR